MASNRLKARPDRFTRPSASELAAKLGLLRLRDVNAHGIPRPWLRVALQEVAPGVWGRRNWPFSRTTVAAKCVPQAVVCLSSALYFHGLLPEEPPEVFLAIGEKARRPRRQQPALHIVRFSGAALSEGVEHHSDQGVPVRVYSVAKTVADLFKYRGKLGYPVAVRALRNALLAGLCTPEEILRFGAICRVTRTLTPYLDVLMARRSADIQAALVNRRALLAPKPEAPRPSSPG
jgi:predicted transcriptional regulator of viral defense system